MRVRAHPRLVGAFVLGAIAILLVAIALLSSEGWFERKDRFSVYFPGSVKGLNRGAAPASVSDKTVSNALILKAGWRERHSRALSSLSWLGGPVAPRKATGKFISISSSMNR